MDKLTETGNRILELLMKMPADIEAARAELEKGEVSQYEVNLIGNRFCEYCYDEDIDNETPGDDAPDWKTYDFFWDEPKNTEPHCIYLKDVIDMLYDFGLDPCADIGGTSIIYMLPHIIFEYTGADALAYILERGVDPNHVESDGEGIFDTLDFDAGFGALEMYSRRRYDAFLHSWIVLIGYGAKPSTLKEDIEILDFIDRENTEEQKKRFRDHRNYYFGLTHFPEKGENWTLHIFDRRSMYEVARL